MEVPQLAISNLELRVSKKLIFLSRLLLLPCMHHDRANFEVSLGPGPWLLGLPTYLNISVTLKLKSIVFTAIVTEGHIRSYNITGGYDIVTSSIL